MTEAYKGSRDYLDLGNWNLACSMCGRKRKASEVVKNWQGQWRCPEHNELRQPQDFVRAVPDIQTPPFIQPEVDTFAGICFPFDQCGIADYGVADCAICDYVSPFTGLPVNTTRTVVTLLSGTTWVVPLDFNPDDNSIECYGKGGVGSVGMANFGGGGGGGGAYSRVVNEALTPGATVAFAVGDTNGTWLAGASFFSCAVAAENGKAGGLNAGGVGGLSANGIGTLKHSGGTGGNRGGTGESSGGGGGGAGGSLGDGAVGGGGSPFFPVGGGGGGSNGGTAGLNGDNGGLAGSPGGGAGGANAVGSDGTASGGGGGVGGVANGSGGKGGDFGGGGGGAGETGTPGTGGVGKIVISYLPI